MIYQGSSDDFSCIHTHKKRGDTTAQGLKPNYPTVGSIKNVPSITGPIDAWGSLL